MTPPVKVPKFWVPVLLRQSVVRWYSPGCIVVPREVAACRKVLLKT
jgi:hypothetical protein